MELSETDSASADQLRLEEEIRKFLEVTEELCLVVTEQTTKETDRLKELLDILNNFKE